MTKRCSKCGEVKPLDGYNRDKSKADGRQSRCRECAGEANRVWREANPERAREHQRVWHEANPGYRRAWREKNADRVREVNRAWNEANPGYMRAWKEVNPGYQRAWQRANSDKMAASKHRRRARKSSAVPQRWTVDHTLGDPLACWWCGRGLLGTAVHTDHVMPIGLGGPAETANEVMSCGSCNIRKKAKHPLVWIAELVE